MPVDGRELLSFGTRLSVFLDWVSFDIELAFPNGDSSLSESENVEPKTLLTTGELDALATEESLSKFVAMQIPQNKTMTKRRLRKPPID